MHRIQIQATFNLRLINIAVTVESTNRCHQQGHVRAVKLHTHTHTQTHTHPFNGPFSETTRVGRYQKGKTNLDFTEARDNEWQWQQLGHIQVCTLLQADNHASTSPLSFLQAGCPSCCPTNSIKALIANTSFQQNPQFSTVLSTNKGGCPI